MTTESKIQSVPFIFRKEDIHPYPADNIPSAEYWFSQNIKDEDIKGDRIFLPIAWTAFYKQANYGNNKDLLKILQNFLNTLDRNKKYFTIIGWDDSILNDISHLDIKVFSMAGGRKDYGLPLIAQPHRIQFNNKKDIFCSFVGRITNPIRQEIVNAYAGKEGYYVSTAHHSLSDYCRILSRSVFGLCPAGYGIQSFRIQECLEYGAIPVLISSKILPIHDLDFFKFGIWIHSDNIRFLDSILTGMPKTHIEQLQSNLKYIFENYFTFESNKKLILENL